MKFSLNFVSQLPFYEEMISQLDFLVDQDRGTKSFQKDFTRIITAQKESVNLYLEN